RIGIGILRDRKYHALGVREKPGRVRNRNRRSIRQQRDTPPAAAVVIVAPQLLFDESRSPKLVEILRDLLPESESVLRNGLAGAGDLTILEYACAGGFVLVSTDSDFEHLVSKFTGANVVILGSCNYPTKIAIEV